ncbi:MAG: TolC family protein [Thauera sp.]|nr:TolC family protein [Thauera sp.]
MKASRFPTRRGLIPRRLMAFGLVVVACQHAWAVEPEATDLPPAAVVRQLLETAPAVNAARHELAASEAQARQLRAGPHEWTLRGDVQQRTVRPENDRRYGEYAAAIERGVRIGGKADIDERLGAVGQDVSRWALGDAQHETAREMLALWFDWLRTDSELAARSRQHALATELARMAEIRLRQGDAARLDLTLAQGAVAQASAQLAAAQARRDEIGGALDIRFPGLRPRAAVVLSEPSDPAGARFDLDALLSRNHELAKARALSRQAMLTAQRADANRMPDPVFGVRVASDKGGDERVLGLSVAIPLGGTARVSASDASLAMARATAAQEAAVEARVRTEASRTLAVVRSSYQTWQRLQAAAAAQQTATDMQEKAWKLGEASIADLLQARRTADELHLAERLARIDALAALQRWRLDTHELWDFDTDEH